MGTTKLYDELKNPIMRGSQAFFHRFYLKMGFTLKPTMIANFAVTYRCNFRCGTCNIWKFDQKNTELLEKELSVKEIEAFFSQNRDLLKDVQFIQLTGGEPFLRKDLSQIISVLHRILPRCRFWIPTNGSMPKIVRREVEIIGNFCEKIGIGVSINGTKKVHDKMTGIEGSYEKAIETVEELVDLKKKLPQLRVAFSFTFTPFNYREIKHVYELAKRYNVDLTFRPVNFSEIYYGNIGKNFDFRDTINELATCLEKIENDMGYNKRLFNPVQLSRLYYTRGILDFIKNPHKRHLPCSAGSLSFFLDPYGNIFPCIMMNTKLGNIREQSFKKIWYSTKAENIRDEILQGNCPNCWVECETYRDIYEQPQKLIIFALKEIMQKFKI